MGTTEAMLEIIEIGAVGADMLRAGGHTPGTARLWGVRNLDIVCVRCMAHANVRLHDGPGNLVLTVECWAGCFPDRLENRNAG